MLRTCYGLGFVFVLFFFLSLLFFKSFSLNATCVECPTFRVVREVLSGSWLEGMELRRCPCFLSVTHSCQVEPQRRGHQPGISPHSQGRREGRYFLKEKKNDKNKSIVHYCIYIYFFFIEENWRETTTVQVCWKGKARQKCFGARLVIGGVRRARAQ